MPLPTSGTYNFSPSGGDLLLESFGRIGIRPSAITTEHIIEARLTAGFVLLDWGNRGVNLWAVDLQTQPLIQGVATYNLPGTTIMVLDSNVRMPPMGSPVSLAPVFATTNGSTTVQITQADHGLGATDFVNIIVPVSIGGIVIQGFYQVLSVIDTSNFTITAASAATATASGGAVPSFATTAASSIVTVTLPAHGLLAGQAFNVQVTTTVGGVILLGSYTVATVVDVNTFTLSVSPVVAGSTASGSENAGLTQIAGQTTTGLPIDLVIMPMSRTEYSNQPNKGQQSRPTSYWFNRQAFVPQLTLWPAPDSNGPYLLQYYRLRELQDLNLTEGETADMPRRMLPAFASEFAFRLGIKYPPDPKSGRDLGTLKELAALDWGTGAGEDRERVPLNLTPDFSRYR